MKEADEADWDDIDLSRLKPNVLVPAATPLFPVFGPCAFTHVTIYHISMDHMRVHHRRQPPASSGNLNEAQTTNMGLMPSGGSAREVRRVL